MQKYLTLNDGNNIPILGLGTWKSEKNKVGDAIKFAINNAGYKHIDCASIYGNEKEIGDSLKNIISSSVKREDLFITSKLWNTDHRPEDVEQACKKTLSDLRLDYLDLYLMHWGIAFVPGKNLEPIRDGKAVTIPISTQQTWQAMEKLVEKGLVKSIGVANFTTVMIVDLLTYAKIKPVMNQIELHPYNSQTELVKYCQQKQIAVTAYSPLGRPGMIERKDLRLVDNEIIIKLAKKYSKSPAQILLNWSINRGAVVIPKSTTPQRITENIDVFDFELTDDDKLEINSLNKNHRFVDPIDWWGVPYFA